MPKSRTDPRSPILVVAPQPFYSDRGTPIAVRQVLEALSELGAQVDVLTFPGGRDLDLPGVRILRCANPFGFRHIPIGFSLQKLVLDFFLAILLFRQLRTRGYVYIHAVEEAAFFAVVLGGLAGVPVLYDMQSSLAEQLSRKRPFRWWPFSSWIVACERWLLARARMVVASYGLGERAMRVLPSSRVREWRFSPCLSTVAVDELAGVREELGLRSGARLVLYCGTFEEYQGLSSLVDAMPRVSARVPETVLALVGDDGRRGSALSRQAAHLGLDGRVRILGQQPRERMGGFLAAADVLVSPRAYGNNLPLKIFDYMAAGKAMIVTHSPAAAELLAHNRGALVGQSSDEIADGLIEILNDPDRAAQLGKNAREYAEEHLGWVRFARSVEEMVEGMTETEASGLIVA
jgi:glycosyltransferase involved in cell wall biosynthesis